MHHVDAKLRVTVEGLFQQFGIAKTRAEAVTAGIIRDARRADSGMNGHRDLEFLGEGKIGLILCIAETETGILRGYLPQYAQPALFKGLAQYTELRQGRIRRAAHTSPSEDAIRSRL